MRLELVSLWQEVLVHNRHKVMPHRLVVECSLLSALYVVYRAKVLRGLHRPPSALIAPSMLARCAADGADDRVPPLPICDAAADRVVGAPANSDRVPSWPLRCARKRPSCSAISSSSARSCLASTATCFAVGSGLFGFRNPMLIPHKMFIELVRRQDQRVSYPDDLLHMSNAGVHHQ